MIDGQVTVRLIDVGVGLQLPDRPAEAGVDEAAPHAPRGVALPGKEDVVRHGSGPAGVVSFEQEHGQGAGGADGETGVPGR